MIIVNKNDLNYELSNIEFTAKVIKSPEAKGEIFIPKFINYESNNYLITSISQNAFKNNHKIKTVEFPKDSGLLTIENNSFYRSSLEKISIPPRLIQIGECSFSFCNKLKQVLIDENSKLRSIGKMAFSYSLLESFTIPSSVEELHEKWCFHVCKLTNINISPKNKYFIYFNQKMIFQKSKFTTEDTYDYIIFARRDITSALIPTFITKIGSYSFSFCTKLQKVTITRKSKLHSIENGAFYGSSITNIYIPRYVTSIGSSTFYGCKKFERIIFSENSELKSFCVETFAFSSIREIKIPFHVKKIEERCFFQCFKLKKVEIDENSELNLIDKNAFNCSNIEYITIPYRLKKIDEYAFSKCRNLVSIEFLGDDIFFGNFCFNECASLYVASFPNAHKISIPINTFRQTLPNFSLFTCCNVSIQQESCNCLFLLQFDSQSN